MPTVHTREYQQIFSLYKQATIYDQVPLDKLNKQRSLRTFAPVRQQDVNITDRAWFGKGHSHPTFVDRIQRLYVLDAQERSATSLELLYAAAFVMGAVTTTVQDSTTPTKYKHVVTWQDLAANKEVHYTTIGEIMGEEFSKILIGAWLNSFTLTGNRDDHVILSYEGGGMKYEDAELTSPGITAAAFYKTLFGKVSFGKSGELADISAEVLSWNMTVSQNATPLYLMGSSVGYEDLVSEVLIGDQTASAQVVIKVNAQHREKFLQSDEVGLKLILGSPTTIGTTVRHECTIELPRMKVAEEAFGEEGQTVSYTMTFSEDTVMKPSSGEVLTLTFISDIGSTELLKVS